MAAEMEKSLRYDFPEATDAEISRFVAGYGGNGKGNVEKIKKAVETRLAAYLEWRKSHGLDKKTEEELSSDAAVWACAVKRAQSTEEAYELESKGAIAGSSSNDEEERAQNIDQVIFFHKSEDDGKTICDRNGNRVLHLLSGLINPNIAPAKIYANSIAFYLDSNFDRNSSEKVTIMVDVRAGEGWPNTPAYGMVTFVKTIIKVFEYNFPERVKKFVVFPVPRIAIGIFNTIKLLFDSNTASKIVLVSGSATVDAPLPKEAIKEHINDDVLDQTEKARLSYFKPVTESAGSSWFSFGGSR